ncbi:MULTISPECIES: hypothetical protein [Burkholderia]|uniref:hypothetical protein n=1 Tax=Burkholderia TaxID=32008 RepID=UPI000B047E8E|nr:MULTISPECIES: hypothetical protein [Burkholderia]
MTAFGNFVELCTHRTAANGDALAYRYLSRHGEDCTLSFGTLDFATRRYTAFLPTEN